MGMPEKHSPSGDSCETVPTLPQTSTEVGGGESLEGFVGLLGFFSQPHPGQKGRTGALLHR